MTKFKKILYLIQRFFDRIMGNKRTVTKISPQELEAFTKTWKIKEKGTSGTFRARKKKIALRKKKKAKRQNKK